MNYPDKFKIKDKYAGFTVEATKDKDNYFFEYDDGRKRYFGKDSAEYIISTFYGVVQEDPEMVVPKEPSLVFPFTFKHADTEYFAKKDSKGSITVGYKDGGWEAGGFPEHELKRKVKDGTYIVTSVGEPKKPASSVIEELVVKINSDGVELATERFTKLAEAAEHAIGALEYLQHLLSEIGGAEASSKWDGCKLAVTQDFVNPVHDYDSFDIEKFFKGK